MGYKSRSNFAPCYSMTDEQFNKIFKKEEKLEIPCTVILKDKGKFIRFFDRVIWEKIRYNLYGKINEYILIKKNSDFRDKFYNLIKWKIKI